MIDQSASLRQIVRAVFSGAFSSPNASIAHVMEASTDCQIVVSWEDGCLIFFLLSGRVGLALSGLRRLRDLKKQFR